MVPTSLTLIYTVPAGRTLIVRTIWLYTAHTSAVTVLLTLNGTATGDRLGNFAVPIQHETIIPYDLVLNPGDELYASTGVASVTTITIVGSLLMGAPS